MNWNHCRNNPGTWQTMQGTATEYHEKTGQFGLYALGKVQDNQGEIVGVLFASKIDQADPRNNRPLPGIACLNQPAIWGGLYDANKNQYRVMFNSYAQPPANEPYHVPAQPPQCPPLPPQAPLGERKVVDATRNSIESQTALNRAVDLAVGRTDLVPDLAKLYDIAAANKAWLQTGAVPPNVLSNPMLRSQPDPDQDDSDLPPELRADYQG